MTEINELDDKALNSQPKTKDEAIAQRNAIINRCQTGIRNSKTRIKELIVDLEKTAPDLLEKMKKERPDLFK